MFRPSATIKVCVLFSLCLGAQVLASDIERQRELFRDVFPSVERGNWDAVRQLDAEDRRLLRAYVLWPDLRATWLRGNINAVGDADINDFIEQFATLKPARELRYQQALRFVRQGNLQGFLKTYEQFYQGQDIDKLDCLALQAEIAAGRHQRVQFRALDLWMVGKSQVAECDPVFKYLDQQKLLGTVEHQKRFRLAIEARNFSLAKWLAKRIDSRHVAIAAEWQRAAASPEDFLASDR